MWSCNRISRQLPINYFPPLIGVDPMSLHFCSIGSWAPFLLDEKLRTWRTSGLVGNTKPQVCQAYNFYTLYMTMLQWLKKGRAGVSTIRTILKRLLELPSYCHNRNMKVCESFLLFILGDMAIKHLLEIELRRQRRTKKYSFKASSCNIVNKI